MFLQNLIYYFFCLVFFVFSILLELILKISHVKLTEDKVDERYDYIIVGGGSAGSILAARLSENSKVSVLLIEAGGDSFDILNTPILGSLKQSSVLDWQYNTIPQKYSCWGLEKNVSKWPAGKVLGGSTHLNYMIYMEGHENDFVSWKDPNSYHWNPEDINYYFKKAKGCNQFFQGNCNKDKGSIDIRNSIHLTKLSEAILYGVKELGYPVNDVHTDSKTGFMKPILYLNSKGKRWTSDQFLKKGKEKKNFKILTNVMVEEILFLNAFEAYGVKVKGFGSKTIIYANLEIIICAGSVGSSKLLMLSGLGPKNDLIKANILPKLDLPVGKNLQDHVTTGMDIGILKHSIFSFMDLTYPSSIYEYFVHGTGPFSSSLVDAVGVISSLTNSFPSSPDLEFMVLMVGLSSDKGIFSRSSIGLSKEVWDEYFGLLGNESVISILPVLLHPKSVGEITLNPSDPKGKPDINPNYLSHEEDVNILVEGIKIIRRLMETESMKNFGVRLNDKIFPGCGFWEFGSDQYWQCYIRHLTLTVYHPVGTCKMALLKDGGVVDHRLKVHKTNKLRVIDASIMPTMPSANTNAAVVMIAEKGADIIKEDFGARFSTCKLQDILILTRMCP